MNQEELFTEQLAALKELAKEKNAPLTLDEVRSAFSDMELDDAQLNLIVNYLKENAKIRVADGSETEDEFVLPDEEEIVYDGEDSRFLKMYLEEIEDLPELTDGKKRALFMNAMNGDESAKKELVEGYLKTVCDIARLYANQGVKMEDLIGEGNVALMTAMDVIEHEADPDDAESMLTSMVMNAMEELVQDDALSKEAFETWAERANEVLEKAKELSEALMRKVTIEELCKEYEFEQDFVKDVIEITGGNIEFLDLGKKEE